MRRTKRQSIDNKPKGVLVMCQRKNGPDIDLQGKIVRVEDSVVPKINKFVQEHIGDAKIDYLSNSEAEGDVDYDLNLDNLPDNKKAQEVIASHKEFYSLIILNTCPIEWIDFNLIYNLMTPDGLLYISIWPEVKERESFNQLVNKIFKLLKQYFAPVARTPHLYRKRSIDKTKKTKRRNTRKTRKNNKV